MSPTLPNTRAEINAVAHRALDYYGSCVDSDPTGLAVENYHLRFALIQIATATDKDRK